ncbi:N-acetylglucosamine kinase-like BadF-type ATPase [Mucilaginibacter gracilis]|uniref:N-acetylglucosamine kinase-like BadF-type ATPase n=1 Tax=Mucilaginibacter gracilis TaxID=423350 RepID=A0A495IZ16_9SPHI|nr:N-acetylglucosamine kinase [Mucilaginibacter gracilis]RKR81812.1 N-acetylglucosamine kinase-like BadF-type ATPase [Mucilaginibacter gracilis]
MIIVADSGSSKTDWLIESPGAEPEEYKTAGLNPYFLNEKEIIKVIQSQAGAIVKRWAEVTEIYFFGAGCSSPDRREIVSNALSHIFPKAFVSVDSDLLGSAYATCGHAKGFCCVLGTGSNISFFDGENIYDGKHGLGYVLGDEGSGNWFGKVLITDYLYGNMPADISDLFYNTYKIDKDVVITHVYQKAAPNSYLASFTKFLSEIKSSAYSQDVIKRGLLEFIDQCIKTYPDYNDYNCHFVGSIAYYFRNELKTLCEENGVHLGKIIKRPINELLAFVKTRDL